MIPLLDTHQHLLYRDRLGYAWADGLPALAGRDFTLDDYAALTAGRGISGTLFMEADADDYAREARVVAALAKKPGSGILGLIAACRPEDTAAFSEWLEEIADLPVVGLRRILHEVPDEVSQGAAFRANVARLGPRDLTFDIVMRADQLPLAAALADACPNTRFVIDHCGVPDIAGGGLDPWRAHMRDLAERGNVVAKVSGVMAYCSPGNATAEAIRPYVSHVIDCFGPERCLWGSDWPVVNKTAGLAEWIAAFRSLIAPLSEDEQRAICNGTAQRVYGVSL
ncbi:amidohydrolase family protein [Seohaeicola nanhaiensis]|uniref:Amidohydrolase family protein n=1 Tax=Seohaeicola nanhaiensis TaxID=1387282 RepID=A0ABV9KDT0_9RHOB